MDAEGELTEKLIYHNDLYVVGRLKDPDIGECAIVQLHLPKDGVSEFVMPLTAATSRDEFRKFMSAEGVAAIKMDAIMEYTMTWINELQETTMAPRAHKQFGWTEEHESFVIGDREITPDGYKKNYPSNATQKMIPFFEKKGTLENWKRMAQFYADTPNQELYQLVVCMGFGSILMDMLPNIPAMALHLYGAGSGEGKTTAVHAAGSIWGNPKDVTVKAQDTGNFLMNRGEIYKNVPLLIDEVTNLKGDDLSNMAYTLTGGMQKGRMKSSANQERTRGAPWAFSVLTTGNTSFVERISVYKAVPKAEAQRVLEAHVTKLGIETSKETTDDFNTLLYENYGHAGEIFAQHVMRNREEVKTLVNDIQTRIDKAFRLTQTNRFWSGGLSTGIAGGLIANQLGLLTYDMDKITRLAGQLVDMNRESAMVLNDDVVETLNNYINEHIGNILKIKSTTDSRGGALTTNSGLDSLVVPDETPRFKLVARFETDTKQLYLIPTPLKNWCTHRHINYSQFLGDMKKKLGAHTGKVRIGKGTNFNLPPANVIIVDCNKLNSPELEDIKEDGVPQGES